MNIENICIYWLTVKAGRAKTEEGITASKIKRRIT